MWNLHRPQKHEILLWAKRIEHETKERWLELVKDYDCTISYYPGKANVVADDLSRKTGRKLAYIVTNEENLAREFNALNLKIIQAPEATDGWIAAIFAKPDLQERLIAAQKADDHLERIRSQIGKEDANEFIKRC